MHKFVVASIIAFVAFQAVFSKPAEQSQIDKLAINAREVVNNVSNIIEGNLPDSKQVSETLTKSAQQLATKVKSVVDDLNKQAQDHKGDFEKVLNSIKENLSTTATKLQEAIGPEAVQKAKEVKATLDDGLNKAIAEAERLAKAAEPEAAKVRTEISNSAKTLLDNIIEVGKYLKTEMDKNIAPKK